MPKLYDYRIFISHAWKYGDSYTRLVNLLERSLNFSYYNYSAPKEKPLFPAGTPKTNAEIGKLITQKINPSQITLVIAGMYTFYSDWMQYEIDESFRLKKPIIAIKPWGAEVTPSYVTSLAAETVNWDTNSIISAIRRLVN